MSDQTYNLSVLVYGLGINAPSHWGLALAWPSSPIGSLYNIRRNSDETAYTYEELHNIRFPDLLLEGTSVLATGISESQKLALESAFRAVEVSDGMEHCQHWVVRTIGKAEELKVVESGTRDVWNDVIEMEAEKVKEKLETQGLSWVENEGKIKRRAEGEVVDAAFFDGGKGPVEKSGSVKKIDSGFMSMFESKFTGIRYDDVDKGSQK
ncbi:hypothetical protein BJ508DRAFT_363123 [Ascobolus immersus RN42]|uniref:Uncharacterized protein n=1 Tax=Ascobolus immersus RN42 TaxID=1160509 RepID=A0A3N4ICS1_ASCIM|nr:hypothetical protein BJ508DRAFT_363123 [Ascobolus immersus RN42]